MNLHDVGSWRRLLAGSHLLSPRFQARHARVLAGLSAGAGAPAVELARELAPENPRMAERALLGLAERPVRGGVPARRVCRLDGPPELVENLAAWAGPGVDLDRLLGGQPALERTRVPLHPDRCATLVPASPAGPLVALAWPAASVAARERNRQRMLGVAAKANRTPSTEALRIEVPADYVIAWMSAGDPWVLAPDYGITVEDELRASALGAGERRRLVEAIARIRQAMLDGGVVWQGFAPRNMFHRGDTLTLIDFEDCTEIDHDPVRAAELPCWHRVFFADCLTPAEQDIVFRPHPKIPSPPDRHRLPADPFERALLGAGEVSWAQRRALLAQSARLEGRHARSRTGRDGGVLFGHELGHFWGDFLPPQTEAGIFRALTAITDDTTLVACLEAFEAAMEADIDNLLHAAAAGDPPPCSSRTAALTDALVAFGPARTAELRFAQPRWYARLDEAPASLIDGLVFAAHGVDPATTSTYLVGQPERRKQHTEHLATAIETGMAFVHADGRRGRFLNYADPDSLRHLLAEPLPHDGQDFETVLSEVDERIARYSIAQAHPGYLAFPDAGNAVAALAGSMLTRLLNQNLIAVDRSAPAATFATIQVVEWLRELVGYAAAPITALHGVRDMAGLWTTGGHLSNHIAMLTALGHAFPHARKRGLRALDTQPAVVMAGPIAHYSHSDAAFHLGLGWDAVIQVPARSNYTTDPAAVDAVLSDPPAGITPFMVVGVAGNCRTTGLDDIAALAEVCRRHGVWFHVDACHGGSLIFNQRLRRQCLGGIEQADSVSLDPHKGLFTPYPSSYVVFRERGVLSQFSRHTATVEQDGCWDLGLITPFLGSCGFEALATWMLLKHVGVHRLGQIVDARQALVRHLERRLDDTGLFVRLNDVDFYRLAFMFCPPRVRAALRSLPDGRHGHARTVVSTFTCRLNTLLYRDGRVCFDEHTLADLDNRIGLGPSTTYTIMACCPGNPLTTVEDLDRAVDHMVEAARQLEEPMLDALHGIDDRSGRRRLAGPAGWSDQ